MTTTDPLDHATDLSDVTRDPVRVWLHNAEVSHSRVKETGDTYYQECRWRKECIKMAYAMGATVNEIAEVLGISREQVMKLRK